MIKSLRSQPHIINICRAIHGVLGEYRSTGLALAFNELDYITLCKSRFLVHGKLGGAKHVLALLAQLLIISQSLLQQIQIRSIHFHQHASIIYILNYQFSIISLSNYLIHFSLNISIFSSTT